MDRRPSTGLTSQNPREQFGPGKRANAPVSQKIVSSGLQPIQRRGLRRTEASEYIGISPSKFDELVKDRRMPTPKRIDGCVIWDIRQLDSAFNHLPGGGDDDDDGQNPWDE
jgi:predicted DNA-binding transcriptional regulator AlpA